MRAGPGALLLIFHVSLSLLAVYKWTPSSIHIEREYGVDASGEYFVPGLQADQRILDAALVVLGHVLVHVRVVLPDVALRAAVRDRPKAEGRGIGVGTLELQSQARGGEWEGGGGAGGRTDGF